MHTQNCIDCTTKASVSALPFEAGARPPGYPPEFLEIVELSLDGSLAEEVIQKLRDGDCQREEHQDQGTGHISGHNNLNNLETNLLHSSDGRAARNNSRNKINVAKIVSHHQISPSRDSAAAGCKGSRITSMWLILRCSPPPCSADILNWGPPKTRP